MASLSRALRETFLGSKITRNFKDRKNSLTVSPRRKGLVQDYIHVIIFMQM